MELGAPVAAGTTAGRGRPFLLLDNGERTLAIRSSSVESVTLRSDWTGQAPHELLPLLGFAPGADSQRERVIVLKTALGQVPVSTHAAVEFVTLPAVLPIPDGFSWGPESRLVAGLAFREEAAEAAEPILVLEVEVLAATAARPAV